MPISDYSYSQSLHSSSNPDFDFRTDQYFIYGVVEKDYMGKKTTRRFDEEHEPAVEREDQFVFEGVTLAHSPQLGRRLAKWLADRRE